MFASFLRLPAVIKRKISLAVLERTLKNVKTAPAYNPENRLLYVAASALPYHISGYTVRTQEILLALKKNNISFVAMTRCGYPWNRFDKLGVPESQYTELEGVGYRHEPLSFWNELYFRYPFAACAKIMAYAAANKVNRIHAASNHVNAIPALLAAKKLGIPFQYEMRGVWELSRASRQPGYENSSGFELGIAFERFVAQNAQRVFVISLALGDYISKNWGIESGKIFLLPNCVDMQRPKFAIQTPPERDLIGYAGSLVGYEGLDTLIDAIKILREHSRSIRLKIVGDGEARLDLENRVNELGLEKQIQFLGRMDGNKANEILSACAMICIPRKPYKVCEIVTPLKLAEAMAMGKPVIIPDLPVFREETGAVANELFFRSGDAADLARVIAHVLDNPLAADEAGKKLRSHVAAKRQWSQYVGQISA